MSRNIARFARSRPVIECAQCGERACGASFETSVRFEVA